MASRGIKSNGAYLMKKTSLLILAGATSLFLSGCDLVGIRGNGHVITDQRPVTDFAEVAASGGLRIEWHSGPPSLSITTDQNLLSHIENRIEGKTLRLRTHDRLRPTHGIKVSISSAQLEGADLRGAVDLIVKNISGSKFYVRASGASDITVDGRVEEFLADLTGATDLRAKDLKTKSTEISSTGASSAKISVSETLRVSITGAGDVTYYGNPKTIEKHVTGAGSIRHKD